MNNNILVNCDTDSIMIAKPDGSAWSKEEQAKFLEVMNQQFPEKINWAHDGIYSAVVVIKSKNYALLPDISMCKPKDLDENGNPKIKLKGSSIRDQKKEPACREMMEKVIEALIYDRKDEVAGIYRKYVTEAMNVKDITRWCSKKSVTESVMACEGYTEADILNKKIRKNEAVVWDAVKHIEGLQQGDKIYLYPVILGNKIIPGEVSAKTGKKLKDKVIELTGLRLKNEWKNDEDKLKLVERVYATISIFESVLDMEQIIDYTLKKNQHLLSELK